MALSTRGILKHKKEGNRWQTGRNGHKLGRINLYLYWLKWEVMLVPYMKKLNNVEEEVGLLWEERRKKGCQKKDIRCPWEGQWVLSKWGSNRFCGTRYQAVGPQEQQAYQVNAGMSASVMETELYWWWALPYIIRLVLTQSTARVKLSEEQGVGEVLCEIGKSENWSLLGWWLEMSHCQ